MTATEVTKTDTKAEKPGYELQVFDELPAAAPRASKLADVMEEVKTKPVGKPILLKRFPSASAATGTANHLKLRWGANSDAYGFKFVTRKIDADNHGVFVTYNPDKIVPGAKDEIDKRYEEFRVKQADEAKAKAATATPKATVSK
jgi:hypothetical protein